MKRAAIYLRISSDPEGLREGVDRQRQDCMALAARAEYEVVRVFEDNDKGASELSRKARPGYDALLDGARAGDFDVIVAYSNSRLTRQMRQLEDLLQLHERHGTIVVTVVSGSDDLSTADGRMVARIKASVDVGEAERMGERIRRAKLERAKAGSVSPGPRPFGWMPDKVELDPTEADLIRKAAANIIDGIGLRTVAQEWNRLGHPTTRGNPWDHRAVRQVLRGPRLVGYRRHQGKVLLNPEGAPVRGIWEPILDPDTFDRLQVALRREHGRSTGRRGSRRYLLSGVLRCAICGRRMFGTPTRMSYAYQCRSLSPTNHTVSASGPAADADVLRVVEARLAQLDLAGRPSSPTEFAGTARLAEIPVKIAELMAAYNAGTLSGALVFAEVAKLESEQANLAAERASFIRSTTRAKPISSRTFEGLDLERQRGIIEELLEAVTVERATSRGAPWTGDRLSFAWRTA